MSGPLCRHPYPVGISWLPWRDPDAPDVTRPVLVLRKGGKSVAVGPDDSESIIAALERMQDAWEDQ